MIKELTSNRNKIILFFILALGLFLRVYQLGRENFFVDEILIADEVSRSLVDFFQYWCKRGYFPGYFIFMHYWMKLFGTGEFAVRFPSAIFGVMSIYVMFLLGKKFFGQKVGLLGSYLFAVSTINIYYAQWAKPYSLTVFFVLLSFLFFAEALEKNTRLLWAGYLCFTLAALFLHVTTLPILISQMLFIALNWPRYKRYITLKQVISTFAIILLVYLPGLFILSVAVAQRTANLLTKFSWSPPGFFSNTAEIFNFFGGLISKHVIHTPTSNPQLVVPTNIFGMLLFLLCFVGIFNAFDFNKNKDSQEKKKEFPGKIFLFLWMGIPLVLPVFSSELSFFGDVTYVLHAACPYYLLIAKGIMSFKPKWRVILISLIMIMGIIFIREYYQVEKNTNWSKICSYIQENIKEGEKTAFALSSQGELNGLRYYGAPFLIVLERKEVLEKITPERIKMNRDELRSLELFSVEELVCKGIWFVSWDRPRQISDILKKIPNNYDLIERKEFSDVSLYHFRTKE